MITWYTLTAPAANWQRPRIDFLAEPILAPVSADFMHRDCPGIRKNWAKLPGAFMVTERKKTAPMMPGAGQRFKVTYGNPD
jgi:hypothetical protein